MKTMLCVGLVCSALWACESDPMREQPETKTEDAGPKAAALRVLAPDEPYQGKSLEEWAVEYVRWSLSQTDCDSALFDEDGSLCSRYQNRDSPVFFIERSDYGRVGVPKTTRTQCHVPASKALLAPVSLLSLDNTDAKTPRSDAELEAMATDLKDSMRNMRLTADGVSIDDLRDRGVGPIRFAYSVPPEPNVFSCNNVKGIAATTIEPAFAIGFLVMFEPPEPGPHQFEFASVFTYNQREYAFQVDNHFTVDEPSE